MWEERGRPGSPHPNTTDGLPHPKNALHAPNTPCHGSAGLGPASGPGGREGRGGRGGRPSPGSPPALNPLRKGVWGPLPMSPEKRGAIGQGGHVRHVLFSTEFFPRLSGSSDGAHRISHTCCRASQEGTGSPQVLVRGPTRPQGVRPQGRWQWGEPWPKGPVGTVGVQRDTWESGASRHPMGSLDTLWDQGAPKALLDIPRASQIPVIPCAVRGVSRHPKGPHTAHGTSRHPLKSLDTIWHQRATMGLLNTP